MQLPRFLRGLRPVVVPALLLGTAVFSGQILVIVSPGIRTQLSLDPAPFGWLLSAWVVAGAFGALAAGWFADRGYTNQAVFILVAMVVAAYWACALPANYWLYMVSFVMIGAGGAGLATIANVAVARAYRTEGTRRGITWLQLLTAAAGMAGPIAWAIAFNRMEDAGLALDRRISTGFLAAGFVILASLIAPILSPLPGREKPRNAESGDAAPAAGPPLAAIALIVVLVFLHTGADNGMYVWLPDFVERNYSPLNIPAAWMISAFSGAYLIGRLALTTLSDRVGDLTLLTIAPALACVFSALAFTSNSDYLLAVFYVLAGLAMSVDYPSILAHIGRNYPDSAGRLMAIAGVVSGVAGFVVPPAMGYVGEAFGTMRAGMLVPSVMLGILAVVSFVARARRRRNTPTE
jgi:MFS transporter, NNP family, nitrate/nitrite transporter